MTLIAAYRPQGIPVLLGDFLITGGGHESTLKKIHKISPNFVVGWTGRRILAAPILKALFDEFAEKFVTMPEVEKFLSDRPSDELNGNELFIIGWVIDDNPHCFLWNISYPTELFYGPYHVAGSGEAKFRELVSSETASVSWGTRQSSVDKAIYSALAKAADLYSDEMLEKLNRRQYFGHAYELLYFDGNEFRYLDNIAFLGMDILLNPATLVGRSKPYDLWYRYSSLGDAAFVQTNNLSTGKITLEAIRPAFNQNLRDASVEIIAGSFRSSYYCIYIRLQTTEGEQFNGSLVLVENKEGGSLYEKYENGQYRLELPPDLIKRLYSSAKAVSEHRKVNKIRFGWGAARTAQKMLRADSKYTAQVGQSDKTIVIGLIHNNEWNNNFDTMDYAIMCCADATIQIYEKGIAVGPLGKRYAAEDTFSLSADETESGVVVNYYRNNELLYTSTVAPEFPLRGAACLFEEGAKIKSSLVHGHWVA